MIKPKTIIANFSFEPEECEKTDWRLKLDFNENIYGVSDSVYNIFRNTNKEDICYYPNKTKLIEKISQKYEIEKDNIVLVHTCKEAIKALFDVYLQKDDELLSYNLLSDSIVLYAKNNEAKVKKIEYDERFVFDIKKITENINEKTKILYISSPDATTGEMVGSPVIEILLKKFQDILVVVDCSYINFANFAVIEDFIDLFNKYKNLVLLKSFANDYALAGLGGAFMISDFEITKNMKKLLPFNNINSVALNCMSYAINDEKTIEEIRELNSIARDELIKGLRELDYEVFDSEANFVLCNFGSHLDFYYEKLKKNGVITKKFKKNSPIETCLRITVPKLSGVKFILELLKIKDVLIFDVDGVIIDETNSYITAVMETFEYFVKEKIDKSEVMQIKSRSGMNCGWDIADFLIKKYGVNAEIHDIINVFQELFFNSKNKNENQLIDKEKLMISKEAVEKLSKKYDLVIFSERFRDEIDYSLEKFGINQYFYYYITSDDLPKSMIKPNPKGLLEILEHCPHNNISYFGDEIDDILAGNAANIETIGVIPPYADFNTSVNNFKHLGASYILDDINLLFEFIQDIKGE